MPELDYNFSDDQLNLISNQDEPQVFDEALGDYIRINVYDESGLFRGSYYSYNDDFTIHRADNTEQIFVKPNEFLEQNQFPSGNYSLEFDFLRDYGNGNRFQCQNLQFYSAGSDTWFNSSYGDNQCIVPFIELDPEPNYEIRAKCVTPDGAEEYSESLTAYSHTVETDDMELFIYTWLPQYVNYSAAELCDNFNAEYEVINTFFVKEISPSRKEVRLLLRDSNNERIVYSFDQSGTPTEIEFLDQLQGYPDIATDCQSVTYTDPWSGNVETVDGDCDTNFGGILEDTISYGGDFWEWMPGYAETDSGWGHSGEIIANCAHGEQVVVASDLNNSGAIELEDFAASPFVTGTQACDSVHVMPYPYAYDWTLNLDNQNIPITNYIFDPTNPPTADLPAGENYGTLILRLSEPVPSSLTTLDHVMLSREIYTTQTQEIYYISQVSDGIGAVHGLSVDTAFETDQYNDDGPDGYQTYDEIASSSFADNSILQKTISGSYQNLNIDYTNFSNHVFFGSAEEKLKNFKTKLSRIESHYSHISRSLSAEGNSLDGDSSTLISTRKTLFKKIQDEIDLFTPYERFLYHDNQQQSSGSAPGLGHNLAKAQPMSSSITLQQSDGFNTVHKVTTTDHVEDGGVTVGLFKNQYRAEEKPFFNYSGSLYLSFLVKSNHTGSFNWVNRNTTYGTDTNFNVGLPEGAFTGSKLLTDTINMTGSWNRVIYEASQSYWRPTSATPNYPYTADVINASNTAHWDILSSSYQVADAADSSSATSYPQVQAFSEPYKSIATVHTSSYGVSWHRFSGSFMPAGELFRVYYTWDGANTQNSYFTDVKITKTNPLEFLPFHNLHSVSSSTFTNWYGGMINSASQYDNDNIHQLVNNLPRLVRDDQDSDDLKKFVNMMGEHFDVLRSHIDNYTNFYNRDYNATDSMPVNLMPILAKNLGWDLISPFTGSLADYFGSSEQDIRVGGRTVEEITHNTWRKILNNLIYIYKTKGTLASVRALLNIYGYPPDMVKIQEFGSSTTPHNEFAAGGFGDDSIEPIPDLDENTTYRQSEEIVHSYVFNGQPSRVQEFDWNIPASPVQTMDALQFILFPSLQVENTISNLSQVVMKSSGSSNESLWDLRLVQSGSHSERAKVQFRLSNLPSTSSTSNLTTNAVSMSSDYFSLTTGRGVNILLQRMTASISGTGVQDFQLSVGQPNNDQPRVDNFQIISMSVSGGLIADSNYYANHNWNSTGSLHRLTGSNLVVGESYSGSMAEFRSWSVPLSSSIFKKHILDATNFSGNSPESSQNELVWRFRMNENHTTGSTGLKLVDSNPSNVKDYSIDLSTDLVTGSTLYASTIMNTSRLGMRTGNIEQPNDNKITISPTEEKITNLNPHASITVPLDDPRENKRKGSTKVEMVRSSAKTLNDFILSAISDLDLGEKIGNPEDSDEYTYKDLDKFRDDFFKHFDINIDLNQFIRGQKTLFNQSSVKAIQNIMPARTTVGRVGVMIEPTILERQKQSSAVMTGTQNDRVHNGEIIVPSSIDVPETDMNAVMEMQDPVEIEQNIIVDQSDMGTNIDSIQDIVVQDSITIIETQPEPTLSSNINVEDEINLPDTVAEPAIPTISDIDIDNEITLIDTQTEPSINTMTDIEIDNEITLINTQTEPSLTTMTDINIDDEIDIESNSSILHIPTGVENYGSEYWLSDRLDLAAQWGTGSEDRHFPNYSGLKDGLSGSYGYSNVNLYDDREIFHMIGDTEEISGSMPSGKSSKVFFDFNNIKSFRYRNFITNKSVWGSNQYKSYVKTFGGDVEGLMDAGTVPIGKTAYYATRSVSDPGIVATSAGDLIYPSNHWTQYPEDPIMQNFNNGTQYTGDRYLTSNVWTDHSTASFYSYEVADENILKVERGTRRGTKR